MTSLNLGPLTAESSFEKMLPSYFVLGVDKSSEDGFSVVGIHLKLWIGKSSPDALDQNEGEVELSVVSGQSLSKSANQLCAPNGSSRATKDVPFCFCEMDACWAFVVSGSFDPIHVSASWKMLVRKFDDKDLRAVLESGQCLP